MKPWVLYGYDSSSSETECPPGPYNKGDEIALTVRPTKAHVLLTLTFSGSMIARLKVQQVRVENDDGTTGCVSEGRLTLRPGLRVQLGDRVIITVQILKRTKRIVFTAAGKAIGPQRGPAYVRRPTN